MSKCNEQPLLKKEKEKRKNFHYRKQVVELKRKWKRTLYELAKNGHFVSVFSLFTFENYERYFFNEILVLIKSKNINVCCFLKMTRTTIFNIEKIV